MQQFQIGPNEAGQRLDKYLKKLYILELELKKVHVMELTDEIEEHKGKGR